MHTKNKSDKANVAFYTRFVHIRNIFRRKERVLHKQNTKKDTAFVIVVLTIPIKVIW